MSPTSIHCGKGLLTLNGMKIATEQKRAFHKFGMLSSTLRKIRKIYKLKRQGMPLKKLFNVILCKMSYKFKRIKVWGYPYTLLIEPTNCCNLKCPLCPTGEGALHRPQGYMSFKMFKKIIDDLANYLIEVNLTNYGEPFLNKDICQMVRYAKDKDIKTLIGTNGHFLKKKNVQDLISAGLDKIYISLDGITQKMYEKYRRGGNFAVVVESIKLLVEEKKRLRSHTPYVELQFLVMRHNEKDIDKMRKFAAEVGVDSLVTKLVSFNISEWDNPQVLKTFKDFIPNQEKYRLYRYLDGFPQWKQPIGKSCSAPYFQAVIICDGSVVPCCYDASGELNLGNVQQGLKGVWNNPNYQSFRRQISKKKNKISLCSKCPGI